MLLPFQKTKEVIDTVICDMLMDKIPWACLHTCLEIAGLGAIQSPTQQFGQVKCVVHTTDSQHFTVSWNSKIDLPVISVQVPGLDYLL